MRQAIGFTSLRHVIILALAVSSFGLTGCENPSREETKPPSLAGASMRAFGTASGEELARDDLNAEEVGDEISVIEQTVASASTWRTADRELRNWLQSPSTVPQFLREQAAAHEMFRQYLTSDRWRADFTKEKAEAVGFYTQLLVKNRSPESDLVHFGLQKLGEHWSGRRIVDAANTTIQAVEREYGPIIENMKRYREDPSSDSLKPRPGLTETRDQHAARLLEANRRLQKMAESVRKAGPASFR